MEWKVVTVEPRVTLGQQVEVQAVELAQVLALVWAVETLAYQEAVE